MTVARRRGFDSRADCGLRPPKSISRNVDASRGGVAKHYNGPVTRLTWSSPHTACRAFWRGVQRHHMDGNLWADVAYSLAVCPHGIVLAGRGAGIRTAAQGTVIGNDRYYAIFHMVGGNEKPSRAMLEASAWCVWELRRQGAGREVRPHSWFRSTACPGPHVPTGEHNRDVTLWSPDPDPDPDPALEDDMPNLNDIVQAVWDHEVRFGTWMRNRWGDSTYTMRRYLRDGYGHARRAEDFAGRNTDAISQLASAVEALTQGDSGKASQCAADAKAIAVEVRRELAAALDD